MFSPSKIPSKNLFFNFFVKNKLQNMNSTVCLCIGKFSVLLYDKISNIFTECASSLRENPAKVSNKNSAKTNMCKKSANLPEVGCMLV